MGGGSQSRPVSEFWEWLKLLIIRECKVYIYIITTIYNNEIRNLLIEEQICSVWGNLQI